MSAWSKLPERFKKRITVKGGHWLWNGCLNNGGYGLLGTTRGPKLAHRLVWQEVVGKPPPVLHHRCPRKNCVRPAHLEPTTNRDHPDSAPAWQAAKTCCSKGHPFDEANTYRRKDGKGRRLCRACRREGMRRR